VKSYDRCSSVGMAGVVGTGTIDVINPTTEQVVASVPDATTTDIDKAVAAARTAFDSGPWPRMAPAERAAILTKVSAALQAEMQPMAELITTEMDRRCHGGPWPRSSPHHDLRLLRRAGLHLRLRRGPPGPHGRGPGGQGAGGCGRCHQPWNVPLFIAAAKLGPALVAGCTVVFKPAPETPLDALRLAELFEEAGLPEVSSVSCPPAVRWASTW